MTETLEAREPREIKSRMFDSTQWRLITPRDDDIVVASWAKSGTTLTQQMIGQLVTEGSETVASHDLSPWVDATFLMPVPVMVEMLEGQTHRRVMKTHLPVDALEMRPTTKYVYVARDARDVLWSAYNHCMSFTPLAYERLNAIEGPWPKWERPELDVRGYYLRWLETDAAPGFHDLPFWSHVQGWWDARHRPNIRLVHYANLIADLPGELRRLAAFLDIEIDEAKFADMVAHCDIAWMRERATGGGMLEMAFEKGAASFFNAGTNGRWRDVLTAEEAARCDEVAAANLTADCAHWLRTGEMEG